MFAPRGFYVNVTRTAAFSALIKEKHLDWFIVTWTQLLVKWKMRSLFKVITTNFDHVRFTSVCISLQISNCFFVLSLECYSAVLD